MNVGLGVRVGLLGGGRVGGGVAVGAGVAVGEGVDVGIGVVVGTRVTVGNSVAGGRGVGVAKGVAVGMGVVVGIWDNILWTSCATLTSIVADISGVGVGAGPVDPQASPTSAQAINVATRPAVGALDECMPGLCLVHPGLFRNRECVVSECRAPTSLFGRVVDVNQPTFSCYDRNTGNDGYPHAIASLV